MIESCWSAIETRPKRHSFLCAHENDRGTPSSFPGDVSFALLRLPAPVTMVVPEQLDSWRSLYRESLKTCRFIPFQNPRVFRKTYLLPSENVWSWRIWFPCLDYQFQHVCMGTSCMFAKTCLLLYTILPVSSFAKRGVQRKLAGTPSFFHGTMTPRFRSPWQSFPCAS